MEDVAFNEWPDIGSGANSWLPAYGFQTPTALLDRDDFLGNPDAEYFLHGTAPTCLYLETIHEETSDDLRSDSEISRESPLGWLATDSETDSVICMDANNDTDCESERELACPIKRRRQEVVLPSEEDYQSLSRSSSLLQFETLEKQCQETSSSSPSIFSVDSYSKDKTPGSESGDSDTTLVSKSCSLDNLSKSPSKKISAENLSEDSGYGDHMLKKRSRFSAYDSYCDFGKIGGKFGASCQNLNLVVGEWVNLEKEECEIKFRTTSTSEPNLLVQDEQSRCDYGAVLSVPKDLDLVGLDDAAKKTSIAAKNWDLADFAKKINEMAAFKREGSYSEAMRNRVDLSDDETSLCYKKKFPKTTIGEFDKKVLQAISESVHSINSISIADAHLSDIYNTPPPIQQSSKRNVVSTPNLVMNVQEQERFIGMIEDERRKSVQDLPRKSSLANHSTSTSCVSDVEEKTLLINYESGSTKEVHFSPVVSEVNWPDHSSTPSTAERESSYSLSSSPDRDLDTLAKSLLGRNPTPPRRTGSQPDLPRNPRFRASFSQSQPDVSRLKRRGSQLIKKDVDGCIIKAYVDGDGIQYKHTHLDVDEPSPLPSATTSHVLQRDVVERKQQQQQQQAVEGMDAVQAQQKTKKKLGGFFSRLTSFRFSTRKDDKKKKKEGERKTEYVMVQQPRVATKADYIYIPLKGGPEAAASSESPIIASSKPPLPRAPPRVIGASVKSKGENAQRRPQYHHHHHHDTEHRRRRTIDSCLRPMEPMGLIETDLDTEVTVITSGTNVKTRSLLNLGAEPRLGCHHLLGTDDNSSIRDNAESAAPTRPHKSMEFLLDKQNLKVVEPPENELQKSDRVMSEHQLRVQRSLQKLTVPEWYKQNQVPQGFLLKKPSKESRWTGTGSKTTSLSSLGSSSASPVILSPTTQPFVRWSTSKLNSTASSPCASIRSSFNTSSSRQPNGSISPSSIRSSFSYRQPYLGWRSQERLSKPRTPAERLANSLLQPQQASPEIQTSIKEVTSAIVHYVSGLKPTESEESRSRSTSPRGSSQKLCWLESSFVGIKPLDSPQTPQPPTSLRLELQTHNDVSHLTTESGPKPSPGSTTLEDVLDSLLGLPSSDRAPSPSLQGRRHVDGVS
nr:PREDICTED: uncharacterized protein LOC661447 isoform X2 [Tribolium castaneum]|eukprot:XP_015839686.1 PREDICTED: uncharacterized protein LOC661447 isoform X2 [Tribolium castaneum]